jgi:hypothetical protein
MTAERSPIRYYSLDEARDEIQQRWANIELRQRVRQFLGERFIPKFEYAPRAIMFRQVLSPDNGAFWFESCARYLWLDPINISYFDDKFVSLNEEKKALARLCVILPDKTRNTLTIADIHNNENAPISSVQTYTGENLIQWHQALLRLSLLPIEVHDFSSWYRHVRGPSEYYVHLLAHAISHGVYFETFDDSPNTGEAEFTRSVVCPALAQIRDLFGLDPVLVRLYPKNQKPEEDFYWFSYPPNINEYLVKWAMEHSLAIKSWKRCGSRLK